MLRATDPTDSTDGASGHRARSRRHRSHHHDLDDGVWRLCAGTEVPAAPGVLGLFVEYDGSSELLESHAAQDMRGTAWDRLRAVMPAFPESDAFRRGARIRFAVRR